MQKIKKEYLNFASKACKHLKICFGKKLFGHHTMFSKLNYPALYKSILYSLYFDFDLNSFSENDFLVARKSIKKIYGMVNDNDGSFFKNNSLKNREKINPIFENMLKKDLERAKIESENDDVSESDSGVTYDEILEDYHDTCIHFTDKSNVKISLSRIYVNFKNYCNENYEVEEMPSKMDLKKMLTNCGYK
jgi:hypothetical protein